MGEIKSTLDLVMEKTIHLSLSDEEKNRQRRMDFEKRLQGILQQYEDRVLSLDSLRDRVAQLQADLDMSDFQLVIEGLFKRIDPDRDNECWLDLIKRFAPEFFDPLREILSSYHERHAGLLEAGGKRILDRLAQYFGITGSAVVPNPEKDALYRESSVALHREVKAGIDAISRRNV